MECTNGNGIHQNGDSHSDSHDKSRDDKRSVSKEHNKENSKSRYDKFSSNNLSFENKSFVINIKIQASSS